MRPEHLDIPTSVWVGFNVYVVALLLLDLLWFNRKAHRPAFREAALLAGFFISCALAVAVFIGVVYGASPALTFLTAYLLEESLSVDNLFVIAVLFSYFRVPPEYQHRVLFWGIFGAVVMRGAMIVLGVALIERFEWLLYVFGAFLVFTGYKLLRNTGEDPVEPGKNPILKFLRRVLPVTRGYHGQHFVLRRMGRTLVTPLFLVLVMVELTDLVFAVDSIPAVLGITTDPFLAYSSNIMAVLGLRALFFLLAGMIERLRYLNVGLGAVLVFVGLKMLFDLLALLSAMGAQAAARLGPGFDGLVEVFHGLATLFEDAHHIPTWASLVIVVTLIGGAAVVSLLADRRSGARAAEAEASDDAEGPENVPVNGAPGERVERPS